LEEKMKRTPFKIAAAGALSTALALSMSFPAAAQNPSYGRSTDRPPAPPLADYTVVPGTRFLVRLEDEITTRKVKENKKFKVKTLEPLAAGNGFVVPPGAEIRGHVSRIEPASLTGRARIWLTFDEIKTRYGKLPIVADVISVPGDRSVKSEPSKEGEIEARRSRGRDELGATVAGAAIGAATGAAAGRSGKSAGIGAAVGAVAGFLIASGMGHELDLPKGSKLELELERPLYLLNK
jgi:hypothetical protein